MKKIENNSEFTSIFILNVILICCDLSLKFQRFHVLMKMPTQCYHDFRYFLFSHLKKSVWVYVADKICSIQHFQAFLFLFSC